MEQMTANTATCLTYTLPRQKERRQNDTAKGNFIVITLRFFYIYSSSLPLANGIFDGIPWVAPLFCCVSRVTRGSVAENCLRSDWGRALCLRAEIALKHD